MILPRYTRITFGSEKYPYTAVQGASLFYFTAIDSPQPRGIIPLEHGVISAGEVSRKTGDRRDKYIIKIEVDPNAEVRKYTYLLSARSSSGQTEWLQVRQHKTGSFVAQQPFTGIADSHFVRRPEVWLAPGAVWDGCTLPSRALAQMMAS
jgi:hypothetical protein